MRRLAVLAGLFLLLPPLDARGWGDEGHEIVALIALHYLTPGVRSTVAALLAGDSSELTPTTGIADEATWADKFRDSDRNAAEVRYRQTREWHYVNIELTRENLDAACFGRPSLPPGVLASAGPAHDCIVDKIQQFRDELRHAATSPAERLLALQFLLHLVGDVHQPLHAADNQDRGGNGVQVKGVSSPPGNLHHYWDTVIVESLGLRSDPVAQSLIATITARQRRRWSAGTPRSWALESYEVARSQVYGKLASPSSSGERLLDGKYLANAAKIAAEQLQKAGVRLAGMLNEALTERSAIPRR
jgi:S1/P1 Nuclease